MMILHRCACRTAVHSAHSAFLGLLGRYTVDDTSVQKRYLKSKGLEAVAETSREEAVAEVLYGRAVVPTLLAADQHYQHHKYKVLNINSAGEASIAHRTGKELGVAVRDMPMFTHSRHTGHHARISIRDNKILIRTELVRAIIHRTSLVLFECRRVSLDERVGFAVLSAIRSAKQRPDSIPFELRMLEVLLEQTVKYLEDKSNQIKMFSFAVQEDIRKNVNEDDIHRLLPLQKAVTELEYDIRETSQAVAEVAESDKLLALLCLSEDQNLTFSRSSGGHWTAHMQLAHRLLMAYAGRIRGLDSHVRELTEHLDSTREIWHMQLDAMRNRIIRLGLHLEFAGFSAMIAALPAGLFGMNLTSGVEEAPELFWQVAAGSVCSGLLMYSALVLVYTVWPLLNSRKRLADMAALKDLVLYNIDDIGDVVQALSLKRSKSEDGAISKEEFSEIVSDIFGSSGNAQVFSKGTIDLLYRIMDRNHDGRIDVGELVKVKNAAVASQESLGNMESYLQLQDKRLSRLPSGAGQYS